MSLNHASGIAAHPQSLPSFRQAFSPSSLGQISQGSRIALPPIQTRPHSRVPSPANTATRSRPQSEEASSSTNPSRKRARPDDSVQNPTSHDTDPASHSPNLARVKEEPEQDMLEPSPPPHSGLQDTSGAPPPSSVHPLKKRRVTVSGAPRPGALNTDVRVPSDQANSTPISPVVIGFTIQRDNPNAVEQVRSMITVKQQQKALIEQRRGSVAGLVSPPNLTSTTVVAADSGSAAPSKAPAPPSSRAVRKSPNSGTGARRLTNASSHPVGPPSPSGMISIPPPPTIPTPGSSSSNLNPHSLPPPPISFARRRANQIGGKKKPADIVISPREQHTKEQLGLSIQSAPPIPRADGQQGSFYSGRATMTLPRLPSVLGAGENVKRVATGNVPPTPTRLSLLRNPSGSGQVSQPIPGISGRSPPTASVAIASTLVPPTPSSLHHPGYSGEKSAFLAPFEMFYDALNDSKQLKNWLGDQLQKSQSLMQSLNQQQEQLHEVVESLVEKKVSAMRAEMGGMQRRIEQLEDALRVANAGRRSSVDFAGPYNRVKEKQVARNGVIPPESYTFPPVAPIDRDRLMPDHRMSSPGWHHMDRERDNVPSGRDSENGSPAPFSSRRLSISASRLDPRVTREGVGCIVHRRLTEKGRTR
ncbi:hypothetical protein BDZ89DRAFT_559256 [Hymenopellis radicata]|nr:hypothetical protein BDZ89DRAFT_559256 [Hymenopellis radicata]